MIKEVTTKMNGCTALHNIARSNKQRHASLVEVFAPLKEPRDYSLDQV